MVLTRWLCAAALIALVARPIPPPARCIRYFALSGKVDEDALRRALDDTGAGAQRLRFGPASCAARPKQSFIAVDVAADASTREIAHRLKKGCDGAEELAWTSFRGVDRALPVVLGQSPRDCVIGMASEMRWFESAGDAKVFFHVPGKLGAKDIVDRFQRLYAPFEAGELGTVERQTVTLALHDAPDAKALERALKGIRKLPGVKSAAAEGTTMTIEVELANQLCSAAPSAEAEPPSRVPLPRFDASQAAAFVAKEGLARESQ
ncbi:MAG: hypothetical protein ACKVWV_11500 [Planctomycetota bacterium]